MMEHAQIVRAPRNPDGRFVIYKPVPADFAVTAPTMTYKALLDRYRCGDPVLRRWCKEAGVKPKPFVPLLLRSLQGPAPVVDDSDAGRAAHHLRRFFPNVFRAEVLPVRERKHLPSAGAGLYIVAGKGSLTVAELVVLAERYGFRVDG